MEIEKKLRAKREQEKRKANFKCVCVSVSATIVGRQRIIRALEYEAWFSLEALILKRERSREATDSEW